MNLSDLYSPTTGMYSNTDLKWVQFIRDHFLLIRDKYCTHVDITDVDMNIYRFRMEDWLSDQKIPQSSMWMVQLLNQMNSPFEFDKVSYMKVPDFSQIAGLYNVYKSTEATKAMNA